MVLSLSDRVPPDVETVPEAATIGGISTAVGLDDDTMADRIQLVSTVEELVDEGLVAEHTTTVDDGERRAYLPTAAGRDRATELRASLADEQIRIETATGVETVPLSAVDQYFDDHPLVSALARASDGVVRLDGGSAADEGPVGREAALDTVDEALTAVDGGGARVFTVAGEPGVGKTTLADAAGRRARDRGFAVATGKCTRDVTDPHEPFAAAFADLDAAAPDLFEGSGETADDQDAFAAERTALFYDVRETIERIATSRPFVLVLDDVHWADDASVDLLSYLLETVPDRTLLLLTYRSEGMHDDGLDDRLTAHVADAHVAVDPFDRAHTRRLVERLLDVPAVPESFADAVYERTGGNPLFVEETVEWLRERGRLDASLDVYPDDLDAVATPVRAREAISERIDPLDEDVRRLLSYLAVAGGNLSTATLAAAADVSLPAVGDYVDLLADSHVLARTEDGVRFASDVVREAILDRLDDDTRRELHADIAATYTNEAVAADGDRHHGEIARHYERAGDEERAIEYYRRAAEDATDVYAHSLAVDRYGRALSLARDRADDAVAELTERLARVHYLGGEYDEAHRYCRFVRQETDDAGALLRVARYEATLLIERGEYDEALSVVEDGLAVDDDDHRDVVFHLLEAKARIQGNLGHLDDAEAVHERALETARETGDPALIGAAQRGLAAVDLERGEMDAASRDLEEAVETLEGTGALRKLAETHRTLGNARWWAGDLAAARDAYERTLALAREMGDHSKEATAYLSLAITAFKEGDWDAAAAHNRSGLEIARDLALANTTATIHGNRGELRLYRGDFAGAREDLERSLSTFDDLDTVRTHRKVVNVDARRQVIEGDLETAARRLQENCETLRDADISEAEGEALEVLGRLHRIRGDVDDALDCHREALSLTESGGSSRAVVVRCELARDHRAAGDHEAAVDAAERARHAAVEMNDAVRTLRADLTLGGCYRAAGRYDDAAAPLDRALDQAREMDAEYFAAKVRYQQGLLARDRGATERARERLTAARDAAAAMGAGTHERRAETALADIQG